jgi:hypothetical protein
LKEVGGLVLTTCNPVTFVSDLEVEAGRFCHLLAVVDISRLLSSQDPMT